MSPFGLWCPDSEDNTRVPRLACGVQILKTIRECPRLACGVQILQTMHGCPCLACGVQILKTIHECPRLAWGVLIFKTIRFSKTYEEALVQFDAGRIVIAGCPRDRAGSMELARRRRLRR